MRIALAAATAAAVLGLPLVVALAGDDTPAGTQQVLPDESGTPAPAAPSSADPTGSGSASPTSTSPDSGSSSAPAPSAVPTGSSDDGRNGDGAHRNRHSGDDDAYYDRDDDHGGHGRGGDDDRADDHSGHGRGGDDGDHGDDDRGGHSGRGHGDDD